VIELSEDAKRLAMRFVIGEITEVQFNFLCHQNNFDKEAILQFIEDMKATGKRAALVFVLLVFTIFTAFLYFLLG